MLRIKWENKGVANAEKIADGIKAGSRIIGNAGALIQSGSQAVESAKNLYDSYVKDGEVISWKNTTDLITLGLSVAGMGMAGKSLAKDGKALKAISQGNVNVKPAAVSNSTVANTSQDGADLQKVIDENSSNLKFDAENKKVDFYVTPHGILIRKNIPEELVENPHRIGSYGVMDKGKFKEVLRIDEATPKGKKGPSYSHYHINGGKEHFSPRPSDSNPLDF